MKSSQVAGLTVGWLAVALSMAAIGSASVGRVGVDTSAPRAQVTVTRTVVVGDSGSRSVVASDTAATTSAPTQPVVATETVAQYAKPVTPARTTAAPTTAATSSAAVQTLQTRAPIVSVAKPGEDTSAQSATPTKGGTKHPSGTKEATASPRPTVVGVSASTWLGAQGAISAGCKASTLAFLDPAPGKGYEDDARSSWLGATVTFSGPTTLSVLVRCCSDGRASFTVLR